MDQISDEKNQDEDWLEGIAIKEAMMRLSDRKAYIIITFFLQVRLKWSCRGNQHISSSSFQIGKNSTQAHEKIYLIN